MTWHHLLVIMQYSIYYIVNVSGDIKKQKHARLIQFLFDTKRFSNKSHNTLHMKADQ